MRNNKLGLGLSPLAFLTLAACGSDKSGGSGFSVTGSVQKGPLSNAFVFLDYNGDNLYDDGTGFNTKEPSTRSDENGDFIYEITLDLERNTHYNYKYRIGPAAVDWNGYWEVGLEECGEGQWSDRYFDTDFSSSMVVGPYCFSSCDNCEIPNHSLSFDGDDDYVDINSFETDGNSSLSVSFWVKLNDLNQNNTVISRSSNSNNIFSFRSSITFLINKIVLSSLNETLSIKIAHSISVSILAFSNWWLSLADGNGKIIAGIL